MIKFQKIVFKFSQAMLIMLLALPVLGATQPQEMLLKQADSLFDTQKYTESFILYDSLYQQDVYSQAMLLRMAYIKEGLGNISEALYFLNEYYLLTSNKATLQKMAGLAKANELEGYQYSDFDLIVGMYQRYRELVITLLLALAVFSTALMLYYLRRYDRKPVIGSIFQLLTLILLVFLVNWGKPSSQGIIMVNETYLMDQPSAGADLVEIVNKGHRVKILDRNEVWVKIRWREGIAFVREKNIRNLLSS